jgi:glycosyltransferase involved in cell wall biosynthesis
MEAMAAGKPIVTTNIPPNAELIEDEITGLLVPTRSPEALACAIARLANDPKLATDCGSAARRRLLERYTIKTMLAKQWQLYLKLTEKNCLEVAIA